MPARLAAWLPAGSSPSQLLPAGPSRQIGTAAKSPRGLCTLPAYLGRLRTCTWVMRILLAACICRRSTSCSQQTFMPQWQLLCHELTPVAGCPLLLLLTETAGASASPIGLEAAFKSEHQTRLLSSVAKTMQIAPWSKRIKQDIHLELFTTRGKGWPSSAGLLVVAEHKRIDEGALLDGPARRTRIAAGAAPASRQYCSDYRDWRRYPVAF